LYEAIIPITCRSLKTKAYKRKKMKRFLITKCGNSFIIWKKTFWGWRSIKSYFDTPVLFSTPEEAETHLRNVYPFKNCYPIVKEVNIQQ
jgi:hypothetical protein